MKIKISYNTLAKCIFFIYMCASLAHNGGSGFDALFVRGSFVFLLAFEVLYLLCQSGRERVKLSDIFCWYLLFIGYYFISMIWGDLDDGFYYLGNFIQIVVTIFVLSVHVKTQNDAISYLKLLLFAMIYMMFRLVLKTPISAWGSERVGAALTMNSNTIGMVCSSAMILCLYYAQENKVYYLFAVMSSAIALFSGSRKGFFMLMAGFAVFYLGKGRGIKIIKNMFIVIAVLGFLGYMVMNNEVLYGILGYRVERAVNSVLGIDTYIMGRRVVDTSLRERAFYRETAMQLFYQKPFGGWGANGFVTYLRRIGYSHVAYSHCNYTELLATLGILGFILYYYIQFRVVVDAVKSFIKSHTIEALLVIDLALVRIFIDYGVVSYMSVFDQVLIVSGYMLIYRCRKSDIQEKENENKKIEKSSKAICFRTQL